MAKTAVPKLKQVKVPGAKAPKLGMKLPATPKAPQLSTTANNFGPYKTASKMPMQPKLPRNGMGTF